MWSRLVYGGWDTSVCSGSSSNVFHLIWSSHESHFRSGTNFCLVSGNSSGVAILAGAWWHEGVWFVWSRVWHFGFETSRFRNFSIFFDGIGIGFGNFWYRKKYRFRKKLVSEKVSVSVSKIFGIGKSIGIGFEKFWYRKKYRYRFRKKLVSEKSFGFGFVQILGFVTHCQVPG